MATEPGTGKRRRTQAERRESTHRKLLDATIEELVEVGYARLTTPAVCQRAGVSQGALFKHFSTKAELVASAAEHLLELLVEDFHRVVREVEGDENRLETTFDLLWDIVSGSRNQVMCELYVSARADAELGESLRPIVASHLEELQRQARELFSDAAKLPNFDEHARVVIDAMQGGSMWMLPTRDDPAGDRARAYIKGLTRVLIDSGGLQGMDGSRREK